jgi:hypothetical protein
MGALPTKYESTWKEKEGKQKVLSRYKIVVDEGVGCFTVKQRRFFTINHSVAT